MSPGLNEALVETIHAGVHSWTAANMMLLSETRVGHKDSDTVDATLFAMYPVAESQYR